ncbi:MAG TPA: nitrate/nitrite transporter [Verrucomicrobiae bacterium]|jgi:NNP family nitrate/nitrite transporter-like MFS transporter|nr:nitrate/nitrite transporter [Verrucomicrobiae bacterium]
MYYVKPDEVVKTMVVSGDSKVGPSTKESSEKNESFWQAGHWPTLLAAFLYFDFSFMVWTVLGPLGAQIGESLHLSVEQKGLMVAVPILSGALLRIVLGLAVDHFGAKATGIAAQAVVISGLLWAWLAGLANFEATLLIGTVLGFAGASFAVALPQAGRWYPPHLQGVVMGLTGAGNIGTVIDAFLAPRIAAAHGWRVVFGLMLIPAVFVLVVYALVSKEAPGEVKRKKLSDYFALLKEKDAHWFCFYYTISFGGFVGLASSYVLYFKSEFHLTAVHAGDLAALCTAVGALVRPVGGALADRLGGIRALYRFYTLAGCALLATAFGAHLYFNVIALCIASGALGMANGSVFQLLPQRFRKELGVMTGLVGCGGGVGGFYLASSLGFSKGLTGSYLTGFLIFSVLCFAALAGLGLVKTRWRTTWGALAQARI